MGRTPLQDEKKENLESDTPSINLEEKNYKQNIFNEKQPILPFSIKTRKKEIKSNEINKKRKGFSINKIRVK